MPDIPSWIRPATPAPYYAQGIGLGLRAQEQAQTAAIRQAQLFAEAQQAQARAAAQAAAQQQEYDVQMQRLAVQRELAGQEAALKQQEIGMASEQMSQRAMLDAAKIGELSRMASAREEYLRMVAGNVPPEEALMRVGPFTGAETAFAATMRSLQKPVEIPTGPITARRIEAEGGQLLGHAVPSASGEGWIPNWAKPERPDLTTQNTYELMLRAQRAITDIQAQNPLLERKSEKDLRPSEKQAMEDIQFWRNIIKNLRSGSPLTGTTSLTTSTTLPVFRDAPKNQKDRNIGTTYRTPKGLYTWTSRGWEAYESPVRE